MNSKLLPLLLALLFTGCLFDFSSKKIYGKYYMVAIDGGKPHLSYALEDDGYIGRIDGTISAFQAIGDMILLVEQADESNLQYFAIDMQRDRDIAEPSEVVLGPMNREGFLRYYSEHFRDLPLDMQTVK